MKKVTRLLSAKQVRELIPFSNAHRARLEAAGKFPQRIRLTNHPRGRYAYDEDEVLAWIAERMASRSPQGA